MDDRQRDLGQWVSHWVHGQGVENERDWQMEPLSGDASFRRYFRVCFSKGVSEVTDASGATLLAVDAPPTSEDTHAFVAIDQLLAELGVLVPEIYAVDYERGYLLISDFGNEHYFDLRESAAVEGLFRRSIDTLVRIQRAAQPPSLPVYDSSMLRTELELFERWFLQTLLNINISDSGRSAISALYDALIENACQQPQVLVHRDYHSRNIMQPREELGDDGPGIIDFQGAVWGPLTYDLVSLLKDCYINWPQDLLQAWLSYYVDQARNSGILAPDVGVERFQRWFELMGLQRHIKVLGIFARLHSRDGKSGYLKDLPLVVAYVREVVNGELAQADPMLKDFGLWFETQVMPAIRREEWFHEISRG